MNQNQLQLRIHTDGGAKGNPGPAGAGIVIADAASGTVLHQAGIWLGQATNNVAEYEGMLYGLRWAAKIGAHSVELWSDSELMVRQMNGQYRVKNAGLKPLYEQARRLAAEVGQVTFHHTRREGNKLADKLVNDAIRARRHVEDAADAG